MSNCSSAAHLAGLRYGKIVLVAQGTNFSELFGAGFTSAECGLFGLGFGNLTLNNFSSFDFILTAFGGKIACTGTILELS